MDIIDKVFQQEDFSRQDLSDSRFRRCRFYQCDFSHCQLQDASFEDCSFIESGAVEGCHFSYADLRDASFKACRLSLANFSGANCFGIEFRSAISRAPTFPGPASTIKSAIRCTSARLISQVATWPIPT